MSLITRYLHKQGHIIWVSLNISLVKDKDGNPLYFIAQFQDTSERKHAEQSLYQANKNLERLNNEKQILSELISNLQECMQLDHAYNSITKCCVQLFSYCSGALYLKQNTQSYFTANASWGKTISKDQVFSATECYALTNKEIYAVNHAENKKLCIHSNTIYSHLCIPLISQNESIGLLYLEFNNVQANIEEHQYPLLVNFTEQLSLAIVNIKLRESLRHESTHDQLTGLFNRRFLDSYLQKEIFKMQRTSTELAVIIIDIDHFKNINDTYGHEVGDTVLNKFGKLLETKLRESDIACRYGGEEFVLILSNISPQDAVDRAEKLRIAISNLKFKTNSTLFFSITASFGIACYPQHGTLCEQLFNAADQALYTAKHNGRNQVVIYQV